MLILVLNLIILIICDIQVHVWRIFIIFFICEHTSAQICVVFPKVKHVLNILMQTNKLKNNINIIVSSL